MNLKFSRFDEARIRNTVRIGRNHVGCGKSMKHFYYSLGIFKHSICI